MKITNDRLMMDTRYFHNEYLNLINLDLKDSQNKGNIFYEKYQRLFILQNSPVEYKRELLFYLRWPLEILLKLKTSDNEIFEGFKSRLSKAKRYGTGYGDLFELFIMDSLKEKGFDCVKRERPDFKIKLNEGVCYAECASIHFESESNPNLKKACRKTKQKIIRKMDKSYSNENTALFIDITPYCRIAETKETASEAIDKLIGLVKDAQRRSNKKISYGSILFFVDADKDFYGFKIF